METLRRARTLLLGSAMILISLGIVMIYSASAIYAHDTMRNSFYFLQRHLVYLGLGLALSRWAARADLRKLRARVQPILIVAVVLLVLVLIPHVGASVKGARRWFRFFGFSFQPSEFVKIALIFYFADFLDRKREVLGDFKKTFLPAMAILGACALLILKQPDFGTAATIAFVTMILFFASGFDLRLLFWAALAAAPAMIYSMVSKPYRRKRLLAFFHPWDDPRGVGFQIIQSFLALDAGGLLGVGLGQSQQKLFYLPESHTDFIFSIIGEELGFLGAGSVIILFAVFIFAGMVIVFRSKDRFTQLFALGLVSLIALEAVINIGVSMGALPTKGLSLPFISYGGSALLANLTALGFLVNVSKESPASEFAPDEEGGDT